jgi:L-alanine-DL-glutamate epimerase-like enolase superfamily enzyme
VIEDIRLGRRAARLREPFATSRGRVEEITAIEATVVAGGRTGVGWASPVTRLTGETLESLEAALAGPVRDAVRGLPLEAALDALAACPAPRAARAAIDLALHDLLAQEGGTTLPGLLGGSATVTTDVTLSAADPAAMAAAAQERVAAGFTALKLKVGVGADVAAVLAVRDAAPGVALRLDANQAWTAQEAIAVLAALHDAGVRLDFVEQPVAAADIEGLHAVRVSSPYPVMADESVQDAADVLRIANREAADLVNLKLAKHGGIRATLRVAEAAAAAGLPCVLGSMMELPGAVAASVLVAGKLAPEATHDLDAGWWLVPGEAPPGPDVDYAPPLVSVSLH